MFYDRKKEYLFLIFPESIEDILINGIITENNLITSSDQAHNQRTFLKDGPVLTTEVVDLILDGFHFGYVIIEGDHVGAGTGGVPTGQGGELVSVVLVL
jgi:hypothetical protein